MVEISKTEYSVMEVIWAESPCDAKQILSKLCEIKPWHEKTVKTLLNRLVKKAALSFEKQGRSYVYYPLIKQKDYTNMASRTFLQRYFRGSLSPFVAHFATENMLKKEDVDELKEIIRSWEEDND